MGDTEGLWSQVKVGWLPSGNTIPPIYINIPPIAFLCPTLLETSLLLVNLSLLTVFYPKSLCSWEDGRHGRTHPSADSQVSPSYGVTLVPILTITPPRIRSTLPFHCPSRGTS